MFQLNENRAGVEVNITPASCEKGNDLLMLCNLLVQTPLHFPCFEKYSLKLCLQYSTSYSLSEHLFMVLKSKNKIISALKYFVFM